MAAPDLPFDPSLPHAVPVPWPGAWAGTAIVYDLYKCEEYVDEQARYMAESRQARIALAARAAEIEHMPDGPERVAAEDTANDAYNAWLRANYIRQLAYFVIEVVYPNGQTAKADAAATWKRFPTRFLRWIANEGWELARQELWGDPKATPSGPPTTSDASAPPSPRTSGSTAS